MDDFKNTERNYSIANGRLEEPEGLNSQYLFAVSHELRESLSTIQSCLKVVLSDLTGSISEKSREMIARAEQRSRYLMDYVQDLVDLWEIRATTELLRERISLTTLLQVMAKRMLSYADAKGVIFSSRLPGAECTLLANRGALEQALGNLIENAISYTPWGGRVTMEARESVKDDNFVVSIRDTGIGIPQEDLYRVFDDFFRARNAEQMEKDGTGLGLSIVREIVQLHGGEIRIESEVGKGTEVILTLPEEGRA